MDQIGGHGKAVSADDHDGVRNINRMEMVVEAMDLGGVDDRSGGRRIARDTGAMVGIYHYEFAILVVVEPGFDLADAIDRFGRHGMNSTARTPPFCGSGAFRRDPLESLVGRDAAGYANDANHNAPWPKRIVTAKTETNDATYIAARCRSIFGEFFDATRPVMRHIATSVAPPPATPTTRESQNAKPCASAEP